MNDSQLRRLLAERSPWRARAGWEAEDPDLRAAGRLPLDYEPEPPRRSASCTSSIH
jgi:hypothetical protein